MTQQLLVEGAWIERRLYESFQICTDDRGEPALFGLIGTPKARIGKDTKLFQSVYEAEVIVRSIASARASATGILLDFGIRIGMR